MASLLNRWFWFECRACRYNKIRYRNAKICPRCKAPLVRQRAVRPGESILDDEGLRLILSRPDD